MSVSRPIVAVIVLLLIACTVLLAKCVSLVRDKAELEHELEDVRWDTDARLARARDFEGDALTLIAEHQLQTLLAEMDENLEGNITIRELVQHAGRGGKVGSKDAITYVSPMIHKKMEPFVKAHLKSHGLDYYLLAGPVNRPFLEAGEGRDYKTCLSDTTCSLVTGSALDGNVTLLFFRTEYGG